MFPVAPQRAHCHSCVAVITFALCHAGAGQPSQQIIHRCVLAGLMSGTAVLRRWERRVGMIHTLGVSDAKRGMIMKGVVRPEIGVTMRARRGATGWVWV